MTRPPIRSILRAFVATASALALAACDQVPDREELVRVTVPPGASFKQVTDSLTARRVVGNALWFRVLGRVRGVDRKVGAGVYEFPPGETMSEVLDALASNRVAAQRFTVPEGRSMFEVAELAEERLQIPADSFLAAAQDPAIVGELGLPGGSLEGFLWPDTYQLPLDVDARGLVQTMARAFERSWDSAWTPRLDTLGMSRRELVALASIVEGEARVDEERETIAGVYHNRLRIGMPLQADPTVQYALRLNTGARKPRLFERDYQTPSPYNTYLNPGLPPGPVASPGRRSIEAALYPAAVPYLFFVADTSGRHTFTRTYDEHLRAVAAARRAARAARAAESD